MESQVCITRNSVTVRTTGLKLSDILVIRVWARVPGYLKLDKVEYQNICLTLLWKYCCPLWIMVCLIWQ